MQQQKKPLLFMVHTMEPDKSNLKSKKMISKDYIQEAYDSSLE